MAHRGIVRWSFTRRYDVGDGPWPTEDEASASFDADGNRVTIRGVFHGGDTSREGCVRRIAHAPAERSLSVDVGLVETGERFAVDVGQRIHYEVAVTFDRELPGRVAVRHLDERSNEQFSTAVTRPGD